MSDTKRPAEVKELVREGIEAMIDTARGLEGLDRAESALRKWHDRDRGRHDQRETSDDAVGK